MLHRISFLLVWVILLYPSPSRCTTRQVPAEIETIQAAIDSSVSGDTIIVAAGTYYENLLAHSKEIFLIGAGPEVTTIDGQNKDRCITLDNGGEISHFTIRNGSTRDFGGGVYVGGSRPARIRDNHIMNCRAAGSDRGLGGGIFVEVAFPDCIIESCRIEDNVAGLSGGGIGDNGYTIIRNNHIARNSCLVSGGGISTLMGFIYQNTLVENHANSVGGGIEGGGQEIRNNTLVGNSHSNPLGLGAGIHINANTPIVRNNLVVRSRGLPGWGTGIGIMCRGYEGGTFACNDSWDNDGPDFELNCGETYQDNFSLDPLFCDAPGGDFSLSPGSPCEGGLCGLVGRLPVDCAGVLLVPTTWSRIKSLFRSGN